MEVAATVNPVTYLMEALRSLILDDLAWGEIWPGFAVVAVLGAAGMSSCRRQTRDDALREQ